MTKLFIRKCLKVSKLFSEKLDIMIKYSILPKTKTLNPIGISIKKFIKFDFSCEHMVCLLCGHSFRKHDRKCAMESPPHFLALANKAMLNTLPHPLSTWALSGAFSFSFCLFAHVFGPCMILHKTTWTCFSVLHGSAWNHDARFYMFFLFSKIT